MSTIVEVRRWDLNRIVLAALGVLCVEVTTNATDELKLDSRIETVLREEADGKVSDRTSELRKIAADSSVAHWHAGHVYLDGKWVSADTLDEKLLSAKQNEYLRRLGTETLDISGHRNLAKWCDEKNLEEQSKAHWYAVLSFNPSDLEARSKLGSERVGNTWFSREELELAKKLGQDRLVQFKSWMPKLRQLANAIEGSDRTKKSKALKDLREIDDPKALDSLLVVALQLDSERARPFVSAIRRFQNREACLTLAKIAIADPTSAAGVEAIEGLKSYRQEFYVPELLSLIEDQIQLQQNFATRPNGTLVLEQAFYRETMDEKSLSVINNHLTLNPTGATSGAAIVGSTANRNGRGVERLNRVLFAVPESNVARDVTSRNVRLQESRTEEIVDRTNAKLSEFRDRVIFVLKQSTGASPGERASDWWLWWDEENDTNRSSTKNYRTTSRDTYDQASYQRNPTLIATSYQRHECLVEGTMIQTHSGLKPVEKIQVGELVVSCDTESGEIGLKPVLRTTVRPPSQVMKLHLDGSSITATLGHYWWVSGRGWLRTRELEPGMRMHTLKGTHSIRSISEVEERYPTYNLIVDEHHTYFVGEHRLLSNDATEVRPTFMKVPGLKASVFAKDYARPETR